MTLGTIFLELNRKSGGISDRYLWLKARKDAVAFGRHFLGPGALQPSQGSTISTMGSSDHTRSPFPKLFNNFPFEQLEDTILSFARTGDLGEESREWQEHKMGTSYKPRLLAQSCTCCQTTIRRQGKVGRLQPMESIALLRWCKAWLTEESMPLFHLFLLKPRGPILELLPPVHLVQFLSAFGQAGDTIHKPQTRTDQKRVKGFVF